MSSGLPAQIGIVGRSDAGGGLTGRSPAAPPAARRGGCAARSYSAIESTTWCSRSLTITPVDGLCRMGQRPADDRGRQALRPTGCPRAAARPRPLTSAARPARSPRCTSACDSEWSAQQVDAAAVAARVVARRGSHAVGGRIHAGRDRRPYRIRLGRTDRREIHRRTAVQQPAEIRQPSFGRARPDVRQRRAVEHQDA